MHRFTSSWGSSLPVVVVAVAAAALVAVLALVLAASGRDHEPRLAFAAGTPTPGGPFDASRVTCADIYLIELEQPVANPKPGTPPIEPGDPVPPQGPIFPGRVGVSVSHLTHNTGTNATTLVNSTYNIGIPGVIGGALPSVPRCAAVDKQVADVTAEAGGPNPSPRTLTVTETSGNPPLVNMMVYWNSSDAALRGFYVVTAASAGSATLLTTAASCNNTPANGDALGELFSCIPSNKGIDPLAYTNSDVVKNELDGDPPRPVFEGMFNTGTNAAPVTNCAASTGKLEGAGQNPWTRTEITTIISKASNAKVPSYGIVQLFNPTTPKTCADIAGQTKRSTNVIVSWALDTFAEGDTSKWNSDWDKDTCLDWRELASPLPLYQNSTPGSFKGGRDPLNPWDCGRNLEGIWGIQVEAAPVTLDGSNNRVPGKFYLCRAAVTHDKGSNALDAAIYCYTDDPSVPVNPLLAPPNNTLTGDGFTGDSFPVGTAPPPAPFGDVDSTHTHLTGSYNPTTDLISLQGCFQSVEGVQGPNIYWQSTNIDPLTGHGTVDVWISRSDCTKPVGTPTYDNANFQFVRHADKNADDTYDFDLDGCPDRNELRDTPGTGGLRDPSNRWDYFNPSNNATNRGKDISAVVAKFGHDQGVAADYDTKYDRNGPITGSNGWNLNPPNGTIRGQDITAAVQSFGHDCGTAAYWSTVKTPTP